MNHEAISQLFFDERYVVPAGQTARRMFDGLAHGRAYAGDMVDAMATGYLVAVLESICVRELRPYLERDDDTVVGNEVVFRHCAPIATGACLRVAGWVERIADREVTFRVQAQDEQEQVCEGTIRLAVVARAHMARVIARKCDAIARRARFEPA
jgi:predicted thioesterase